ncbi:hypothetical protein QFZ56_007362 [Streptomyces achromogenes]|uniref:Uncharacterized protein n=1 Tax=Streptomyces achromogenes TaxID=67255 RepID=A0ABU0QCL7_STRAH|nr:hypothetical protein [Streptomyces achromogenes]
MFSPKPGARGRRATVGGEAYPPVGRGGGAGRAGADPGAECADRARGEGNRGSAGDRGVGSGRPHGCGPNGAPGRCEPFLRCISDDQDVTTALPRLTRVRGRRFAAHRAVSRPGAAPAPGIAGRRTSRPAISRKGGSLATGCRGLTIRQRRHREGGSGAEPAAREPGSFFGSISDMSTHPALIEASRRPRGAGFIGGRVVWPPSRQARPWRKGPGRGRADKPAEIHPRNPLSAADSASMVTLPPYIR